MLEKYLKRLHEITSRGDAHEESSYSALVRLLDDHAVWVKRKNVEIARLAEGTLLPKMVSISCEEG